MRKKLFTIWGWLVLTFFTLVVFAQGTEYEVKKWLDNYYWSPFNEVKDGAKFEKLFIEKRSIPLSESQHFSIGSITDAEVSKTGKIYLADPQSHCIAVYNLEGKLIQQIGRQGNGPGEFQLPNHLELYNNTVLVSDIRTSRVSLFSESGEFLGSFVTSAEHYVPQEIKVNSKGDIYLCGVIFDEQLKGPKPTYVHKYKANFDYEKSFYPFNSRIVALNLWSERGITWDIDDRDNLYIADHVEYKISKYSESGELLRSFNRDAKFYKPPSKFPELPREKIATGIREWLPTWTHLIRLVCYKNLLFVQFRVHQPSQYLIEIYDLKGDYIMGEILTNYLLLCSGKDGFIYFLNSDPSQSDEGYSIGQFGVKLTYAQER